MRIALVAQNGSPLAPATSQEPMSPAASVAAHARELAKLGHRVTINAQWAVTTRTAAGDRG